MGEEERRGREGRGEKEKRTLSHMRRDDKMTAEIVDLKRLLEKVRGEWERRGRDGRGGGREGIGEEDFESYQKG